MSLMLSGRILASTKQKKTTTKTSRMQKILLGGFKVLPELDSSYISADLS